MKSPGIVAHSVIIGISLGASDSPKTIRPLVATLTFHQFFEGMGLTGCIVKVYSFKFNILTFSSKGIFDTSLARILIYMALVDLLEADFMNPNFRVSSPRMQTSRQPQIGANIILFLGAKCMSLLAKWARIWFVQKIYISF
ncbi:hypothetical protein PVL29_003856 [Vitis rotundifolia]|uniref:Uncharacterized protein n=1 Tax=Vitis rotundifolia TaxID=103349 RepID=A0AA39AGP6_VITRO|nr:hypothetical protein PVL29_003856 [Vitis rotundifolia]